MSRYTFIRTHGAPWPLTVVCRVLVVSRAGYYAWRGRQRLASKPPSASAIPQSAAAAPAHNPPLDWQPVARKTFFDHARRYGTRRLRAELQSQGYKVGRYALRSWLRTNNLRALSTRPQRPRTTQADPNHQVSENLLLHRPAPTAPDQVWVGDITYLPLASGEWCYLATWRDAFSRQVVGWNIDGQMPAQLVVTALERALALRNPAPGLIVHADRGSQYTGASCRNRILEAHALPSYARVGNPYDNAQAEAGWSTLKTELLPNRAAFTDLEEARSEVENYLQYFNLQRRHSAIGYLTPHLFERQFFLNRIFETV